MIERIVTVVILLGAAYWYWSGPYQERVNPTYGQKLAKNARDMEECKERKSYAAGRMVSAAGNVEEICARQLNLYFENGNWHSYEDSRPD
jgi:hypothetical protein